MATSTLIHDSRKLADAYDAEAARLRDTANGRTRKLSRRLAAILENQARNLRREIDRLDEEVAIFENAEKALDTV